MMGPLNELGDIRQSQVSALVVCFRPLVIARLMTNIVLGGFRRVNNCMLRSDFFVLSLDRHNFCVDRKRGRERESQRMHTSTHTYTHTHMPVEIVILQDISTLHTFVMLFSSHNRSSRRSSSDRSTGGSYKSETSGSYCLQDLWRQDRSCSCTSRCRVELHGVG